MGFLSYVDQGLARRWLRTKGQLRRMSRRPTDQALIDRYRLMFDDNADARPCYKAGEFWKNINVDFRDLIWAGALNDLRDQYFNSRFSGPSPTSRQIYSYFMWLYYQRLLAIDHLGFLKVARDPSEGGINNQVVIDGRPLSLDLLQSIEEAYSMLEGWSASGRPGVPQIFVELGAGYGRLAFVVRKMFPDSTYVILDLPEALMCSSSWLERVLPGEVEPYERSRSRQEFSRAVLRERRVWTLGAQQIERLSVEAADVFANIFSFAEMPKASIDNYFGHVDRITSGLFYTKQRKVESNTEDGVIISESSYAVRDHWTRCFYRTTSLEPNFFEAAYTTRAKRPEALDEGRDR